MPSWIDSHAHLSDTPLLEQKASILERAKKANISHILNVCCSIESLENGLLLEKEEKQIIIKNAAATHPNEAIDGKKNLPLFEEHAKKNNLVAIGEIGLDYFHMNTEKIFQQEVFSLYMELASKYTLPIIIHCREAYQDLFPLLKNFSGKVVLHCFSGSWDDAKKALEKNYFLSFSGTLTYPKNQELRNIAKKVPLENLLIETDSPFLAPQGHRGKQNEPSYLVETATCLANIKEISEEELSVHLLKNNQELFFKT